MVLPAQALSASEALALLVLLEEVLLVGVQVEGLEQGLVVGVLAA